MGPFETRPSDMTTNSVATAPSDLLYWGMSGWEVIVTVSANAASFTSFERTGRPLRQVLVAAYGPNVGLDVTAEAFAYAWENWDRLHAMENPAGYLCRVGQSKAVAASSEGLPPSRCPASLTGLTGTSLPSETPSPACPTSNAPQFFRSTSIWARPPGVI